MPTDEASFLSLWQECCAQASTPHELAVQGGAVADTFAWIFMAGYQAAIRDIFGWHDPSYWLAFAASEDRTGNQPAVTLEDGRLQGCKTWVAGSDHVAQLIITVGRGESRQYLLVAADAVRLERREGDARFLGQLSQGFAHFINCSTFEELHPDTPERFSAAEARFVHLAYCAYVRAHIPELRDQAEALIADGSEPNQVLRLLAAQENLPHTHLPHWARDKRAIEMYAKH